MHAFLIALAVLIGGYFIYGAIVDKIIGTCTDTPMPAYSKADGVDYTPMPTWKVFLIQFLNIAGLGPIFGAIMGIMFGPAAFLWIVLGTIFAGAVHDFLSGVISIRMGGASLPEIVGHELGNGVKQVMRVFSVVLLVLVVAVFVLTPADLLASMTPSWLDRSVWIAIILGYYILATLLPIDKLIGNLYPLFGFALLFMAVGLLGYLLFSGIDIPSGFESGLANRHGGDHSVNPIFPMMFVSIACGAISGFHATQSPMMARCLTNEKLARPIFYGAMVTEGIVALIWAAAAIAFAGSYENLTSYMAEHGNSAGALVKEISVTWLGTIGGILALLGVIAAPISTGDTALRSARLIVADILNISQKTFVKRLMVCLPLFVASFVLMLIDFNVLWRYFAWSNQTLAVFTLWAVTVYLARHGKAFIVSLLPALFMTAVSVSYLLFAPRPEGFGLSISIAVAAGIVVATVFLALFLRWNSKFGKNKVLLSD
ncbi:MAG: carbon starvation protein A [Paramuribaculum sp.]|nr:carbon starvation protein A [Paramuribaculum sp.]MDE5836062.1 carbon starvation protein A [Paramuribaculum sp.]